MTVNKVILLGNLGADPEIKYSQSGLAVLSISVATNKTVKDKQTGEKKQIVEWHKVDLFDKLAESVAQHLKKGDSIFIEGELKTNQYIDKQTKEKKYSTSVIATSFKFVGGKKKDETTAQEYSKASGSTGSGLSDFIDDDVPF